MLRKKLIFGYIAKKLQEMPLKEYRNDKGTTDCEW
jgi:hypothetical protein